MAGLGETAMAIFYLQRSYKKCVAVRMEKEEFNNMLKVTSGINPQDKMNFGLKTKTSTFRGALDGTMNVLGLRKETIARMSFNEIKTGDLFFVETFRRGRKVVTITTSASGKKISRSAYKTAKKKSLETIA